MFYTYFIDVFALKVILKASKHFGVFFKVVVVKLYIAMLCICWVLCDKLCHLIHGSEYHKISVIFSAV